MYTKTNVQWIKDKDPVDEESIGEYLYDLGKTF